MIDLHVHTLYSDGVDTPEQVIRKAAALGIKTIAITDHDTVSGLQEAMYWGDRLGVRVIPGVEISSKYEGHTVHIVGLFIDPDNEVLLEGLDWEASKRVERNAKVIARLVELGIDITPAELCTLGGLGTATKGNIAKVLVDKGYETDISDTIKKYLNRGGLAYFEREDLHPERSIEMIHAAGGLAFVAHFHQISRRYPETAEDCCRRIIAMGADGLETRYCEFMPEQQATAEQIQRDTGCLASGGSDYHGDMKPGLELGIGYGSLEVPDEFLTVLENSLHSR